MGHAQSEERTLTKELPSSNPGLVAVSPQYSTKARTEEASLGVKTLPSSDLHRTFLPL